VQDKKEGESQLVLFVYCVKQVPTAAISVDNNDSSIVVNRKFRNKLNSLDDTCVDRRFVGKKSFRFRGVICRPSILGFPNSEGKPKRRRISCKEEGAHKRTHAYSQGNKKKTREKNIPKP
jgi:hypothetical protein